MTLIYSTSKALNKWLKAELPTLEGSQKGKDINRNNIAIISLVKANSYIDNQLY